MLPIRSLVVVLLSFGLTNTSNAQAISELEVEAYLTAQPCVELPAIESMQLIAPDNTGEYQALGKQFSRAIKGKNITLSDSAPYEFSFTVDTRRAAAQPRQGDLVTAGTGKLSPGLGSVRQVGVHVNIWSTSRDNVLTGRVGGQVGEDVDQLRLEVFITDKRNGQCVWQGNAEVNLEGRDAWEVAEVVAPYMVNAMGKTLRREATQITD